MHKTCYDDDIPSIILTFTNFQSFAVSIQITNKSLIFLSGTNDASFCAKWNTSSRTYRMTSTKEKVNVIKKNDLSHFDIFLHNLHLYSNEENTLLYIKEGRRI